MRSSAVYRVKVVRIVLVEEKSSVDTTDLDEGGY